jgi:teichoic acid transport system permease protein
VGGTPRPLAYLRGLWQAREFCYLLALSQLKSGTARTSLGLLWYVLNPLLQAAVYYIVFGRILGATRGVEDYPAFLIIGVFTFLYSSRAVSSGARSLVTQSRLVAQLRFPRAVVPLSAALAELLSHLPALVVMVGLVVVLTGDVSASFLLLPLLVLVQSIFNAGVAMGAARLLYQSRDVQNLLPHVLRFWLYFSGVLYPRERVERVVGEDSWLLAVYEVNPAYVYIDLSRDLLLDGEPGDPVRWALAVAWALVALVVGFFAFRSREQEYSLG